MAACVPCSKALSEKLLRKMGEHITSTRATTQPSQRYGSYPLKGYGSQQSTTTSTANGPFSAIEDTVWDRIRWSRAINASVITSLGGYLHLEKGGGLSKEWECELVNV
jgi:hypothetical protein